MDRHRIPERLVIEFGTDRISPRLRAAATATIRVDPDGPLYDHTAQALALDAVSSVEGDLPWNTTTVPGVSTYEVRVSLSRNGIDSTGYWASPTRTCCRRGPRCVRCGAHRRLAR